MNKGFCSAEFGSWARRVRDCLENGVFWQNLGVGIGVEMSVDSDLDSESDSDTDGDEQREILPILFMP